MEIGGEISIKIHKKVKGIFNCLKKRKITAIKKFLLHIRSIDVYYDPLKISIKEIILQL